MTREDLRELARQRTLEIEVNFAHRHVPPHIIAAYMLYRAIAIADLHEYLDELGAIPISATEARAGKAEMSWGDQLNGFEQDCIRTINNFVERTRRPQLARVHPLNRGHL